MLTFTSPLSASMSLTSLSSENFCRGLVGCVKAEDAGGCHGCASNGVLCCAVLLTQRASTLPFHSNPPKVS